MWFFVGVGYMVVGVAFCLLGAIKLPGGRVLRAAHAQVCGVILLCYFPLVFLLRPFIEDLDALVKWLINGALATLCLVAVLVVIMKSTRLPRPVRKFETKAALPAGATKLFTDAPNGEAPAMEPKPTATPPASSKNPFDFS
jgi:hypothetical protein